MITRTFIHRSLLAAIAAVSIPGITPTHAIAQATAPATTQSFDAKITGVEGFVHVRTRADGKWEAATVGMIVPEGAELRTGPRSAVRFVIPPDQTISLDRLGVIQILRSSFENGKIVTDIGMKYGRTHYDIDAQGRQHDAKVISPSSVLAIRGTEVIMYDQPPFAPQAVSLTGRAFFRDAHKQVSFGGPGAGITKVDEDNDTPASTARGNAVSDPRGKFAGRTQTDQLLQLSLAAYGGADFSNLGVLAFFDQARAGTFKGSFVGALPIGRQLSFSLFWTSAPSADVDLTVTSPLGEVLSPTITTSASSGHHMGNAVADESGIGQEQVVWEISYPVGNYTVKAELKRGATASAEVFAIDDPLTTGQVIGNFSGTLTPQNPVITSTVNATGQLQQTPQSVKKASSAKAAKPTKVQKPAPVKRK